MPKILFHSISELITNTGVVKKNGVGIQKEDLGIITDGAMVWDSKKGIEWIGKTSEVPKKLSSKIKIKKNLKNKILTPALVDCHTHLVFGGSRHNEFELKLSGANYQQIAASGGGIVSSVANTRKASSAELYAVAKNKIKFLLKQGVGVLEIKSGYGLDLETEIKVLKVIQKLKKEFANKMLIQSTFLGAHAFPPEFTNNRDGYVDHLIKNILPLVHKQKLADFCDVFCDQGYYTVEQSRKILTAAKKLGLKIKLHADELADVNAAALAADLQAVSADHLLKANEAGLRKMAEQNVTAVLLPSTAFYLSEPYAPVEKMRNAKLCMAVASDYNPGSSPILNLPFALSLAVLKMGMTPAEGFAAVTYAGAKALGLEKTQGFLQVGYKPFFTVFDCPSFLSLIQNVAHPGLAIL